MIGFKLKVQQFSQGELFEIVVMQGICHLVSDDVPQTYASIFQGGRGEERRNEARE